MEQKTSYKKPMRKTLPNTPLTEEIEEAIDEVASISYDLATAHEWGTSEAIYSLEKEQTEAKRKLRQLISQRR
jgi:hypothetical protein